MTSVQKRQPVGTTNAQRGRTEPKRETRIASSLIIGYPLRRRTLVSAYLLTARQAALKDFVMSNEHTRSLTSNKHPTRATAHEVVPWHRC